jgi:hypothetical protein
MIAKEAAIVLTKATEAFVTELTLRAWDQRRAPVREYLTVRLAGIQQLPAVCVEEGRSLMQTALLGSA